jgi:hypothetical protein
MLLLSATVSCRGHKGLVDGSSGKSREIEDNGLVRSANIVGDITKFIVWR